MNSITQILLDFLVCLNRLNTSMLVISFLIHHIKLLILAFGLFAFLIELTIILLAVQLIILHYLVLILIHISQYVFIDSERLFIRQFSSCLRIVLYWLASSSILVKVYVTLVKVKEVVLVVWAVIYLYWELSLCKYLWGLLRYFLSSQELQVVHRLYIYVTHLEVFIIVMSDNRLEFIGIDTLDLSNYSDLNLLMFILWLWNV